MAVIETEGLRKEFRRLRGGRTVALDGLDLTVPEGGVFGFLGPNGSGKTTTIRCLLGLARPSSGRWRLLGAGSQRELAGVLGRVGSIVEAPALFAGMSGRRNLQLLGRMDGIGPGRVDETLDIVGLGARGGDLVKRYSLGMKQRLAIGAALLKDPEVLILDEPANGLDPAGIREIRELIRRLGGEGRTVFVSSHILSEIQQVADHVAILSRGRCVAAGSVKEVIQRSRPGGLVVRLGDLERGREVLQAAGVSGTIEVDRLLVATDDAELVSRSLAQQGLYVTELRPDEIDLESVFLEITGEGEQIG